MREILCESRILRVEVYARGAEVTREVKIPEDLDPHEVVLRLDGLTPLSEAGSFRAAVTGERQIVSVKAQLVLPQTTEGGGELLRAVRELQLTRGRLALEQQILVQRRDLLQKLSLRQTTTGIRRRVQPTQKIQNLLQGNRFIQEKLRQIDEESVALETRLEDNAKALERALVQAQQGNHKERHGDKTPTRSVLIHLGAPGEIKALSLTYTVPAARWWPAYSARLSSNATRASISLEAFVAQATGEDWKGVELALSTADLVYDARLPELASLRIGRAQSRHKKGFREPPAGLDEMFRGFDQAFLAPAALPPVVPASSSGEMMRDPRLSSGTTRTPTPNKPMRGAAGGEVDASELFSLALASRDKTIVPERAADLPTDMLYERAKKREEPVTLLPDMAEDGDMPPIAPQSKSAPRGSLVGGLVGGIVGGVTSAFGGAKADEGGRAHAPRSHRTIEPAEADVSDAWLDFDSLTLSETKGARRGKLTRINEPTFSSGASQELEHVEAPYLTRDPRETRGQFDHRYLAQGRCELPSNGKAHRIQLSSAEASSIQRLRAAPKEAQEVYREVSVKNPFDAPLLAGPVDIFSDGALLRTALLQAVDRGGFLLLGLGVEERVRISRNARVEEASAGFLVGKTTVDHVVSIEAASALGYPTMIEIIDRIPVSDDKAVEITLSQSVPASQWYDQAERGRPIRGGLYWQVDLPAAGKARIEFSYKITLPAKSEVVGGNRRES